MTLLAPLPQSRDLTDVQDALDKVISSDLPSTIKEVSGNHTEPFYPSVCDRESTDSHANPEYLPPFLFFLS